MLDAAEFNYYMYMQLISLEDNVQKSHYFLYFARAKKTKIVLLLLVFLPKIASRNHSFAVPTLLRVGDTNL